MTNSSSSPGVTGTDQLEVGPGREQLNLDAQLVMRPTKLECLPVIPGDHAQPLAMAAAGDCVQGGVVEIVIAHRERELQVHRLGELVELVRRPAASGGAGRGRDETQNRQESKPSNERLHDAYPA